jgi:hypothetical protein
LVAQRMLNDHLGVIEGSIALAGYAHRIVPDWRVDPDFRLFGAIASETDHLPFGEVRDRWSQDGLAKADAEIEAISDAYRPKVREGLHKSNRAIWRRQTSWSTPRDPLSTRWTEGARAYRRIRMEQISAAAPRATNILPCY